MYNKKNNKTNFNNKLLVRSQQLVSSRNVNYHLQSFYNKGKWEVLSFFNTLQNNNYNYCRLQVLCNYRTQNLCCYITNNTIMIVILLLEYLY